MNGWMDGMGRCMDDGHMDWWMNSMDGWMMDAGYMDGWMNNVGTWMDGWMDP